MYDYLNANDKNTYSLYVGGNYNNDANAGAGYANSNNRVDNSNSNIGARLACTDRTSTHRDPHFTDSVENRNVRQQPLGSFRKDVEEWFADRRRYP